MAKKNSLVIVQCGKAYKIGPNQLMQYAKDSLAGNISSDWKTYAELIGDAIVMPDSVTSVKDPVVQTVMSRATLMMNFKE